jgi:hypothetical protein
MDAPMKAVLLQRDVGRQVLLALLVLALSFLNFGHTSAVFAAGGRVVVTAQSVCGDQPSPSAGDHFTCHGCRQDLPALPPPPLAALPVVFAITTIVYAGNEVVAPAPVPVVAAQPRGPPGLV